MKAKSSERQEEKRDTTNQSKTHLARATDSPRSRPCNPSNSRVRPARHSSRANPAKINRIKPRLRMIENLIRERRT